MDFDLNNLNEEEKYALLFGIMAGDGCLSKYKPSDRRSFGYSISITGNYYDDRPFFDLIVPLIEHLREKSIPIRENPSKGKIEVNFTDKVLFHKIKNLGFPIGKKGQKLIIPKIFYEKDLLKYIVQGFFATDGSLVLTKNPNKYYPRLEAHVIHKRFIKQLYDYLSFLGLKGHFYKCKRIKEGPRWKVVQEKYRFQFNGKTNLLLFNDLIGFINPKQNKKFQEFINYDAEYNKVIKGIDSINQKFLKESINSKFKKRMAVVGIKPTTSSS